MAFCETFSLVSLTFVKDFRCIWGRDTVWQLWHFTKSHCRLRCSSTPWSHQGSFPSHTSTLQWADSAHCQHVTWPGLSAVTDFLFTVFIHSFSNLSKNKKSVRFDYLDIHNGLQLQCIDWTIYCTRLNSQQCLKCHIINTTITLPPPGGCGAKCVQTLVYHVHHCIFQKLATGTENVP